MSQDNEDNPNQPHDEAGQTPRDPNSSPSDPTIRPDPSAAGSSTVAFTGGQPKEQLPERIGRYRVVRRLGAGGMGLVYLALRDDDQFKRRVAIKIIKRGMDSEAILQRFEQERQVLAALNHPNIARLLDGGISETGQPYFVMEYVEGMAIDEYCDKNRLSIEERLELFRTLCLAVHHAHANLIVHRDLKPSNIVVTQDGTLKLLDFGIAKLLNPDLSTFANDPTQTSLRLMTPEYASPEQVRGDPISTASDIYSLGVLLYEIVTGKRPYRFRTRLQSEIERIICEEEPDRPSTAISRAVHDEQQKDPTTRLTDHEGGSTVEEIAKKRVVKPTILRRRLAGDIDNIVLMAMRKEPRRRYASAEQFAEDVRRHLTGMPVIARKASAPYRFAKFVRRNRWGVAAAAAIALSLIAGIIVANWQRNEAMAAQQKAERRFALARKIPEASIFEFYDAIKHLQGSTAAIELLVSRSLDYLNQLANEEPDNLILQREVAAALSRLGQVQGGLRSKNLGDERAALSTYAKAIDILQTVAKRDSNPNVQRELAVLHIKVADLQEKGSAAQRSGYQNAYLLMSGVQSPDIEVRRIKMAAALKLGDGIKASDQAEAMRYYKEYMNDCQTCLAEAPKDERLRRDLCVGYSRLADVESLASQYEEALRYFQQSLQCRSVLLSEKPESTQYQRDVLWAHYFLGRTHQEMSNLDKARESYEAALQLALPLANDATDARAKNDLQLVQEALNTVLSQAKTASNVNP